jgi:hypothetical protein
MRYNKYKRGVETAIDPNTHIGRHCCGFYSGTFEGGKQIDDDGGKLLYIQICLVLFPTTSIYPLFSFQVFLD